MPTRDLDSSAPVPASALPRTPVAWALVLAPALVLVCLHLVTNAGYGMFRDEYYYLACAKRLDWGYVDHPPLSIAILAAWTTVFGDGAWSLRVLPTLCGGAVVVVAGLIAAELGGRRVAQLLAAIAIGTAGVTAVLTGFYSMNAFDVLLWALAWWLLARWLRTGEPRLWVWLGLVLGLALMNKVGILVLGVALAAALVLTPERRWLTTRWPWIGGAVAAVIFAPHVVWQVAHGWPSLEFIENAQRHKIAAMTLTQFLGEVVLEQHPPGAIVWLAGLAWLLVAPSARRFRLLGLSALFTLALLVVQASKPYYVAGVFPLLFAAGACAWDTWTREGRRTRQVPALLAAVLVASWVPLIPLAYPMLSPERFARWQQTLGIVPVASEPSHAAAELPQHYSDRFGWEELAIEVSKAYRSLPAEDRASSVVIADNYGQAAALEYWARRYELPPVVSGHNNYFLWGPGERPWEPALVVGYSEDQARDAYADVRPVAEVRAPWALQRSTVLVARGLKVPRESLWPRLRSFI